MPVSADYLAYVLDQFANFTKVTSRRMFGGVGLYADGLFFALIAEDALYFKVDDSNRDDYVRHGSPAFQPFKDDPTYSMNYFLLPAEALEDPDELQQWARRALAVAASAAAAKEQRSRAAKKRQRSIGRSKSTRRKR
jgi:DNA transformation protein